MKSENNKPIATSDAAILWLARLNAPDVSAAEQMQFEKWLSASPANQMAYIRAEQLWERGDFLKNVTSRTTHSHMDIGLWLRPLTAVAVVVVFITLYFASSLFRAEPDFVKEYSTRFGEMVDVVLPDGSSALLHANTAIVVSYNDALRSVQLTSGEAFFNVTEDKKRPFDVVTSQGRARVMGTSFSINQNAEVIVLEGRVGLAHTNGSFEPLTVLQPNQKLSVAAAAAGESPVQVDANFELAWRKKRLVYKGETLDVVIADLERFYDKKIIAEEPAILDVNVVIVLHLSDFSSTISSLAGALNLSTQFNAGGDQVILHSISK